MTGETGEEYLAKLKASKSKEDQDLAASIERAAQISVRPTRDEEVIDRLDVVTGRAKPQAGGAVISGAGVGERRQGAQKKLDEPGIDYQKKVNEAQS